MNSGVDEKQLHTLRFTVPGKPAPQGSKRHVGRGILIESCKDVGMWRDRVTLAAHLAMNGQPLLTGAVAVGITFVLPRPLSTPKRRTPPAVKKPDVDKLARAVLDSITHTVIADDSQVTELYAAKRLAELEEPPHAGIIIEQLIDGARHGHRRDIVCDGFCATDECVCPQ